MRMRLKPSALSRPRQESRTVKMKLSSLFYTFLLVVVVAFISGGAADKDAEKSKNAKKVKKLQIGIKKRVDPDKCTKKSRKGDILHMHYTGKLDDGTEFDSSIPRGNPFVFTLGSGQVIRGWDQGLLNMCEGEKRKLVIPPDMGYGESGAPPKIPGNAVLNFEVELIKIERKEEL